ITDFNYPLLIELVQSHPHLYDKSLVDFKDDLVRSKTNRKIAKILEVTEAEVVQKWKNLRDRYTREKKKIIRSGSEASTNQWPYLKQMSFLDRFIRQRNSFKRSISPKPRSRSRSSLRSIAPVPQPFELVYLSNSSNSSIHSSPPSPRSRSESPSVPLPKPPTLSPQLTPEPPQYVPKERVEKNINIKKGDEFELLALAQNLANDLKSGRREKTSNQLFGEYLGNRLDDLPLDKAQELRKTMFLLLETN
ncbi:unnamed protein product, partial [Brassicogethes aeneus]